MAELAFQAGSIVRARGREWVVLPESGGEVLVLRPLGGGEERTARIYVPLEPEPVEPATFPPPSADRVGGRAAGLLLRDALTLRLRAGAGPFRSFGNIGIEPRPYQLVPLLMALKQETVRLLIADDVGVGKTIEACLIARELLDRGEIERLAVLCPPHLCDQWQEELARHFHIRAEVVRTATVARLERGLPAGRSLFEAHPFTVVSLDYIKSDRHRDEFRRVCPEFVIVDEAHTCTHGQVRARHLRYELLRALARDRLAGGGLRHMVLLTATPHSGDEQAFYRLLGLLDPEFERLAELEGEARERLRQRLGEHFVQRRRPDIREWDDRNVFPDRRTREVTYRLTGAWGRIFNGALEYARDAIRRSEGLERRRRIMHWWAVLALLRCMSSSPAAAVQALRTRIEAEAGGAADALAEDLAEELAAAVMDGGEDALSTDDSVPAAVTDERVEALSVLEAEARDLHGPENDPKLAVLIREVRALLEEGFSPVVFCRYVATAHYVAEHLKPALGEVAVTAVTGELTPAEREERVYALREAERRVLVATDCLSEGINLQELFDAVVHYDLSWNPTRHEQREGRVDRFGQRSPEVRALMLYGEDNPVDGAVLRVILEKAERIRKELGVHVPMPEDPNKVTEAVLQAVLLGRGSLSDGQRQLDLTLDELDARLEGEWQSLRERARRTRTIFVQSRLRPEDVMPEWQRVVEAVGGEEDVARFVTLAAERLGAPLERRGEAFRLPVRHLPAPLCERLAAAGIGEQLDLAFRWPVPHGAVHVSRTHPLVSAFADYVAELALEEAGSGAGEGNGSGEVAARTAALFTVAVDAVTVLWLLRLRMQLTFIRGRRVRNLLAEEALTVATRGAGGPEVLPHAEARRLLGTMAERNMAPELRARHVRRALNRLPDLRAAFDDLARARAADVLADHRRVRDAAQARGRYEVEPVLPPDVVGVYVLVPARSL